jgi:preprotein translocase subunit SecF
MELFKYTKTYNFMGKSKFAMILSVALVLGSYILLMTKGLNYGVDFAGGTIVQVKYDTAAPIDQMREKLKENDMFSGASITEFGSPEEVVIRMKTTSAMLQTI